MIGLFDKLKHELNAFLEGNDKGVMITSVAGMQMGYVIKSLKDIEDAGSPDVFLVYPQNFVSPNDFANQVVERISLSYETARDELGLQQASLDFEAEVSAMRDEQCPAVDRIRASLGLARALLPSDGTKRVVFGMLPLSCDDELAYTRLVEQLVTTDSRIPWSYGMRILVGEDSTSDLQKERLTLLANAPHTTRREFDFSTEAIMQQLEDDVEDPNASEAKQAESLLQLATMESAHDRHDSAILKFQRVLPYFQQSNNPSMQAVVMTGLGDAHRRLGNAARALAWYESALIPAAESKSPIIVFSLGKTLGELHFEHQEYEQAESYFDGCQQIGPTTNDPAARIEALRWRGLTQMKRGSHEQAATSFEEAATVCREFDRFDLLRPVLEGLRDARRELGEDDLVRQIDQQLSTLPTKGVDNHVAT